MDEAEVIKTIIEGGGVIVLDEETFDEVMKIFNYPYKQVIKTKDTFPYRIHGIPIAWVRGGFKKLVGGQDENNT